jgi:5-methylcytosine-specific restriction enzyme A
MHEHRFLPIALPSAPPLASVGIPGVYSRPIMPVIPLSPCAAPRCPGRAPFGKRFCAAHETATRKASSVERSRDPLTRYNDAPWRRLRQAWLNAHPLCVACEAEGRVTVAQVVDHLVAVVDDPSRRLDWSNLRSLCKSCHDRHTAKTRGWGKASR